MLHSLSEYRTRVNMLFSAPLISGRLIQRYKRFLADVILDSGETITAHCPNSGSMLGVKEPGSRVWLSKSPEGTKRKYPHTWEMIEVEGTLVGIHTTLANKLVEEALLEGSIEEFQVYKSIRREVAYGQNSRVDFLLQQEDLPDVYLEVKSVHLSAGAVARFPDAVTARGTKHLKELAAMRAAGARAVVLYVVQREDVTSFDLAREIDPVYAKTSREVLMTGVEALCYACAVSLEGIKVVRPIPFAF
jgi:sugar fermentation stimulation protein A